MAAASVSLALGGCATQGGGEALLTTGSDPVSTKSDLSLKMVLATDPNNVFCSNWLKSTGRLAAGCPLTSTITVKNEGSEAVTGVQVNAPHPNGWLAAKLQHPTELCTLVGEQPTPDLQCDLGTLQPGESKEILVAGNTNPAVDPYVLSSVVTVSSDGIDITPESSVVAGIMRIVPQADLSVDLTTQATTMTPGMQGEIVGTVTNNGPSVAKAVRIYSAVGDPLDTIFTGSTIVAGDDAVGATCDGFDQDNATSRCVVEELPPGASVVVHVAGGLSSDLAANTPVSGSMGVSALTADPDTDNNNSTVHVQSGKPQAYLMIGTTGPHAVAPGERATWTMTVEDGGPSDSTNTRVDLTIPANLTNVTVTSDHGVCTDKGCDLGTLLASADAQMPGNTANISITGTVGGLGAFTIGGKVHSDNSTTRSIDGATVTPRTIQGEPGMLTDFTDEAADPDAYADVDSANVPDVPFSADSSVMDDPDGSVMAPDPSVTVDNADEPAGLEGSVNQSGPLSRLQAANAPINVTEFPVTVDSTLIVDNGEDDPQADIAVTNFKITELDPNYTGPGSLRRIQFTVTNNGPDRAQYPWFRLARSTDAEIAAAPQPYLQSLATNLDLCQTTPRELMCAVTDAEYLEVGQSVNIDYEIRLARMGREGAYTDYLHGYSQTADPDETNNYVQEDIVVGKPESDLRLHATAEDTVHNVGSAGSIPSLLNPDRDASFIAGGQFTYQVIIEVPEEEMSDAVNAVATFELPLGFNATSAQTAAGQCKIDGRTVTCDLPVIAAVYLASSDRITVTGHVDERANIMQPGDTDSWAEKVPMTVKVTSTTPKKGGGSIDSEATVYVDIVESADLELYVTPDQAGYYGPETVGYTITALNNGPSAIEHAAFAVAVPEGYELDIADSDCVVPDGTPVGVGGIEADLFNFNPEWVSQASNVVVCEARANLSPALNAGEAGQARVVFQQIPGAATHAGTATFTVGTARMASQFSTAVDPNPNNNTVTVSTTPPMRAITFAAADK